MMMDYTLLLHCKTVTYLLLDYILPSTISLQCTTMIYLLLDYTRACWAFLCPIISW